MVSRVLQRLALAAVLVGGVTLAVTSPAEATRPVRRTNRPTAARGFNLFAGSVNVVMNVNRVQCNINNIGESCVDPTNSPAVGGGFWPRGTGNQYIFNSGLQIAGIIPGADQPNFPWPGDTVGAFFFDPRGDQAHGEGRTNVFNALNSDDLANWPTAAGINDTSLFNAALIGRQTVSQQDTWVRFWDGNTSLSNGRQHPMGLLVEQRGLMWNFPSGNQDIVYFLYRFVNITSTDPTKYAGLANFGYSAQDISDIVAIATEFQQRSEAAFNVQIPDSGYQFTNVFASFAQDPDIGSAGSNYSNANLVFNLAMAYKSDYREATWAYPPDINGAPFSASPGFEAVKYLKSPQNIGIAMSGNTTNGAPFPDAVGVQRLWRNLSGNLLPTDGTCSVTNPQVRRFCYWAQVPADTRFFESSGPFTLNPGESAVIVVAYVHAAPMASAPAATPPFGPAISAFSLTPFIGASPGMVPGFALSGNRLLNGLDTLRAVDRAMGWLNHTADVNANGQIDQTEVITQPRSLLNKSLVAQAVFDNKFLLPFAPEVPEFYLVPGDNQVTVAWAKSTTETLGDPFFAIASNIASPLYDPNFRKFDVEGYRIWRGRTSASLEVVAAFDYAGTTITDFTGQFFDGAVYGNRCAPELGIVVTCPAFPHAILLSGDVLQVPPGGRVQLASGDVFNVEVDTAVTGGGSGLPSLSDTGVPFAYVDNTVRNGFRYFYAVTAFDVNSVKSGPTSLESPLVTKTVTPRAPSSNNLPAIVTVGMFGSDGVTELNPNAAFPLLDAANGTFTGIIPPADGGSFDFLASVAEALPPGDYTAKIDSVTAGSPASISGVQPRVYVTFSAPGVTQALNFPLPLPSHGDPPALTANFGISTPLVPYDTMRSRLVGIPLSFSSTARMPVTFSADFEPISGGPSATMLCGRGLISAANCGGGATVQASRYLLHSRWSDEGTAESPDPTLTMNPSPDHNSGKLTGVTNIWNPILYRIPLGAGGVTRAPALFRYYAYGLSSWHPADFVVTWGAAGAVTIRDSTHRTDLPYRRDLGAGYGFVSGAAIAAAGITTATLQFAGAELGAPNPAVPSYHSIYSVIPVCNVTIPASGNAAIPCAALSQTAVLQGLDFSNPADGVSDGNGIVLVINGEFFFMNMAALPAAGTKWHLRAIGGLGMTATCTPSLGVTVAEFVTPPTDCSNYSYTTPNAVRPPVVPGLQYKIRVTQAFEVTPASGDLSNIHTVPDPYYVTNSLEQTANTKVLRFVNLPERAIIRIYSSSGILVNIVNHNNEGGGGEEVWNLRNRNNQFVASGVYYYHVEAADGKTHVGRFTVVNYAQ